MVDLTVFTCVMGGFESLDKAASGAPIRSEGIRFVIITDHQRGGVIQGKNGAWEIMNPIWEHPDSPRRTARFHKINAHLIFPDTECSIWIDGSQEFKPVDPRIILREALHPHDLAAFFHPDRQCAYQEGEACKRFLKDDPGLIDRQMDRYKFEGYPINNGLVETTCVCRRHTATTAKFNEVWWKEIETGSVRDQLSFNYAAWKTDIQYGYVPGHRDRSPYFVFHTHKVRR